MFSRTCRGKHERGRARRQWESAGLVVRGGRGARRRTVTANKERADAPPSPAPAPAPARRIGNRTLFLTFPVSVCPVALCNKVNGQKQKQKQELCTVFLEWHRAVAAGLSALCFPISASAGNL